MLCDESRNFKLRSSDKDNARVNIPRFKLLLCSNNEALRIITGAGKSTPVLAMQALTNTEPFSKSIQRKTVVLFQKLTSLPNNLFWRNYDLNIARNLKSHDGFMQQTRKIACSVELCREASILPLPFWIIFNLNCQVIYSQFRLAIHQNDHQARRKFVEWAQNEIAVVPDFHKRILFSDKAHFWLNGYVNNQNCCIWSEANPQVYVKTPLHPEKLTVWCALWAGGILLQKR
ncbi:hypothetical protein TNCV_1475661 [Trichonephila clavipes]|nr:hypothetical protein TNCV_1475661 [Trichonephila clavipes]